MKPLTLLCLLFVVACSSESPTAPEPEPPGTEIGDVDPNMEIWVCYPDGHCVNINAKPAP